MPSLPAIGSPNWGTPLDTWMFTAHNADGTPNSLSGLIPTSIKTSNYAASAGDFIPCDVSGGSITVSLPAAPTDRCCIGIKIIANPGTNNVTIIAGGSDVFNRSSGPATLTLSTQYEAYYIQYSRSTGIWYANDIIHLSSLDNRYVQLGVLLINVKDFGAKGDGTTDDTTAIQNAINSNSGSIIVYFPHGNYITSSSLIVDRNQVTLLAFGEDFNTQITIASTADPTYAMIVGNSQNVLYCTVYGLTLKGRNNTTSTGGGILLQGSRCSLKQVRVEQFGGTGVDITGFGGASINDVLLDDVYLEQNGKNSTTPGDNLVIGSPANDCEYHRVISAGDAAKSTSRYGINNSGFSQKFVNCHAYFSSSHGFYQNAGSGLEIVGGEWETNVGDNIHLANITNFMLSSLEAFGTSSNKDILISFSSYGSIVGCNLNSSTTDKNLHTDNSHNISVSGSIMKGGSSCSLDIGPSSTRHTVTGNCFSTGKVSISGNDNIISSNMLDGVNIVEQTGANNNKIECNEMFAGGTITKVGVNTEVRFNKNFITENYSTASITSGNTSVIVTHGLALTPTLAQISVTPQSSLGSAHFFWVSSPTSTQFTINVDVAPGSTITFGWKAEVGY